jgi:hypothetical protein
MKNIALAIDDEVLNKVRAYAVEHKTTVNAIVRRQLEKIAGGNDMRAEARRQLLRLAETSRGRMSPDHIWSREELYDRPMLRRHKRARLSGKAEK